MSLKYLDIKYYTGNVVRFAPMVEAASTSEKLVSFNQTTYATMKTPKST
jgi:hypothetical protein